MSYRRKRWVYERALVAERERDQWQAIADRYRDRCAGLEAAIKALVEQVRHDNEGEAEYRAVGAELGVSEWEAFMPVPWHQGREALEAP